MLGALLAANGGVGGSVPCLKCFPLEPFFEINPGILFSGIGS